MGRRSINTTKSGKYMNPTDQARKEARKKELKKNKRQRQMVRAAVLKNKDPSQILEEMEKIDEMEYNVLQPSPLNEKVLRDKRKKLKETFDRVMRLYQHDEPEHWSELKRKEAEYEKRRLKKQQYYESVKHAQSVQIDEIPLPAPAPTATASPNTGFGSGGIRLPPPPVSLALPPFAPGAPPSLVKKSDDDAASKSPDRIVEEENKDTELLGVPPGPPPNLFEMSDLDTDAENDEVKLKHYSPPRKSSPSRKSKPPNSLQQRMLAISGQNIDEFMKEMENVHKKKHADKEEQSNEEDDDDDNDDNDNDDDEDNDSVPEADESSKSNDDNDSPNESEDTDNDNHSDSTSENSHKKIVKRRFIEPEETTSKEKLKAAAGATTQTSNPVISVPIPIPSVPTIVQSPTVAPSNAPTALPPVNVVAPHMQMPPVHGIAPPPPMLFRPPPMRPPGMHNYGMRMPPGPPPGPRPHSISNFPQRMGMRMPPGPPPGLPPRLAHHLKPPHPSHPNHPQQHQHHQNQHQMPHVKDPSKGITTITAKPQIRNLSADVTRFVPSTLRIKREETRKPPRPKPYTDGHGHGHGPDRSMHHSSHTTEAKKSTTKDDAYMQFMNEMQGLL